MTEPEPSPEPTLDPSPGKASGRPALPWQAVVAATVLALVAAGLVLVVASGRDGGADPEAAADGETLQLRPADEVPSGDPLDIELTDPDGGTTTIREQLGDSPMVVNFFASWCPPCIKEMPDFEAVAGDLDGRVDFLGLAVTDRPEDAERIVDETGITYPWARDGRGDVAGAVGVVQMPTTVFVTPDGTVTEVHAGALDRDALRRLVEEHLGVAT